MGWREINYNDIILYLKDWKSREDVGKHFELSPIESWHCVKFLSKMRGDIMVQSCMGKTRRSKIYCARKLCYERVLIEEADKKLSKSYDTQEKIPEEKISNIETKGNNKTIKIDTQKISKSDKTKGDGISENNTTSGKKQRKNKKK